MRFNFKNNVHLEGWAAADVQLSNMANDSGALLLAIKTETPREGGRSEKGRELIEIELRKVELDFIPKIRKGTKLLIDGVLRIRTEQGQRRELIVTAIRIQSPDWEGYKTEGLKAMTEHMTEEQTQLMERWKSSALEYRR